MHSPAVKRLSNLRIKRDFLKSEYLKERQTVRLLVDIGLAEQLLGRVGEISRLTVHSTQSLNRPKLSSLAPDLVIVKAEQGGGVERLTDSFHLNLTAFGLLAFVVGLFIVHGTIGLAFEQRRNVFRTLRVLGLSARSLVVALLIELLGIALLAGALGVIIGYGVAAFLLPDVAATLRGLYGAQVEGALSIRAEWWLSGFAIAVGGTLIAAGSSLVKLIRHADPGIGSTTCLGHGGPPIIAHSDRSIRILAGLGHVYGDFRKWSYMWGLQLSVLFWLVQHFCYQPSCA